MRAVVLALALLLVGFPTSLYAATAWWRDPVVRRVLALTSGQVASIDAAFRVTLAERRSCRLQLSALEENVRRMMARGTSDDAAADALISKLERLRAKRNILRTMMLLRMHRILSPGQRAALRRLARRSLLSEPGADDRRPSERADIRSRPGA